jgi:hypothetical protein
MNNPSAKIISEDTADHKYCSVEQVNRDIWDGILTESELENVGTKFQKTLWEITSIVDRKKENKAIWYLLQWKGLNGRDFVL